ncbi:MAG: alanine racemase [Candidatus Zixiibacteriota bacterium]
MFYTSHIELHKSALQNNIDFLKKELGPIVKLSSVVKGNAYGHGIKTFVPMAEGCGVDHFSVFSAYEALQAHEARKSKTTIMIMGQIENDELAWAIENDVEFFVFELDRLDKAIEIAKRMGKKAKVHIEVETGMNRTGFQVKQLGCVLDRLQHFSDQLVFQGLCTHYAGAESIANYVRVKKQKMQFQKIARWLKRVKVLPKYHHTACSAAAMTYPKTRMDMVRIGIMQYGFWSSKETFIHYISKREDKNDPLRCLITWKSKVMSTKEAEIGEFIGYGTDYLAQNKTKIAIIPVGYSQGFSRSLSHQGRVLIHDQYCDVIGIVNMNLVMVNITELENVQKGDEVVLIGTQGRNSISVASFGEFSNLLNYELLTRLPEHIPRIPIE